MTASETLARAAAVLVDLDGTLIDSEAAARRAWQAFAERHGLDPRVVYACAQGRPSRETVRVLAPEADHAYEAGLLEAAEVGDTRGVVALSGAARILTSTRSLAIVTSCSLKLARARLVAAGLLIPEYLVTSDDVEHGKPDPACFRLAAQRLSVQVEQCVVLEDAPAGIAAGRAAGATVIALRNTHGDNQLREADWIVNDLMELLPDDPGASPD